MNKKTFCIIATVVCLGIVLMLLSACGQSGKQFAGRYYKVDNQVLDGDSWIELTRKGKWLDDEGAAGKYEVEDGIIDFYIDGSSEVFISGTISGDDLIISFFGAETHYRRGNPGDSVIDNPAGDEDTNKPSDDQKTEYEVVFNLNYNGRPTVKKTTVNQLIDFIPVREGYVFNGWWYSDGETDSGYILSRKHNMNDPITQNGVVLYAEWVIAADKATQLAAPVVSMEGNHFYWDHVENATKYTISIRSNNEEIRTITVSDTEYFFSSTFDYGYYTIGVQANGNGINTYNSSWTTKEYAHKILSKAENISFDESTSILKWDAVNNANEYTIYLNGEPADTVFSTMYDMSLYDAGNYNVRLVASRLGWGSSSVTVNIEKVRLKTPVVKITESGSDYQITWDAVYGADTYIILLNGHEIRTEELGYKIDCGSNAFWDTQNQIIFTVNAYDSTANRIISLGAKEYTVTRLFRVTLEATEGGGSIAIKGETVQINDNTYAVKNGDNITVTATTNAGYIFKGWYDGANKLTDTLSYKFMPAENKTYTAKWETDSNFEQFNFISDPNKIIITGVKNNNINTLIIPDYVGVEIIVTDNAFSGCNNIQTATIPATAISAIPKNNLKTVIITGGNEIADNAFSGCSSLTSVTIGSERRNKHRRWCFLGLQRAYIGEHRQQCDKHRGECFLGLQQAYDINYPRRRD